MEPPTLSASQLAVYLGCPLKYRFQYVDQIPRPWRIGALAFGASVHAAVEWFHREHLAGRTPAAEDALRIFEADWYAQNLEPLVFSERETSEGLGEKGAAMVRLYCQQQEGRPAPLAVEHPFRVDLHDPETGEVLGVAFRGFIDLIEADGTVVDLKTAGRSLSDGDLQRHLQLSAYALAGLIATGEIPKLRLDMLYKTTRPKFEQLETSRSLEELAWTAQLIRQVAEGIWSGQFYPNPSWRCTECEYFAHCQGWRGQRHQKKGEVSGEVAA